MNGAESAASINLDLAGKLDGIKIFGASLSAAEMSMIREMSFDAFGRARDISPDIGAFEYISPSTIIFQNYYNRRRKQ